MKRSPAPYGSTAAIVAAAALALCGTTAQAAPAKKSKSASAGKPVAAQTVAPAPAPAPPPVEKKGMFTRAKEMLGLKKKEQPVAEVPPAPAPAVKKSTASTKTKAAPASAQPAATEGNSREKTKPVPSETAAAKAKKKSTEKVTPAPVPPQETAAAGEPAKRGWFKRLIPWSKKEAPPADQHLANAKTARPAPVKEVKPAPKVETVAVPAGETGEKRGFFGFFRRLREPANTISDDGAVADSSKIERPADWEEHKVVTESGTALYTFGPMQPNGPDRRLDSGSVVKLKSIRRGWALVEVDGGTAGYIDASTLRAARKDDFKDPPPPTMMAATGADPNYWAPLAPPPDLPDQPSKADADAALLLLPPLELEPKPKPATP